MIWTEEEIKHLKKYAAETFKTEIPLSAEIEKIQLFIQQNTGYRKIGSKLVRTNSVGLRWLPDFWTYPVEVDIPDNIMGIILEQSKTLLDQRCDELSNLCGYKMGNNTNQNIKTKEACVC